MKQEEAVPVGFALGQNLIGAVVYTHLRALDGLDGGERVGPEQHPVLPDPRDQPQVAQIDDLGLFVPVFPIGIPHGKQEEPSSASADIVQGKSPARLFVQGKGQVKFFAVNPFGQILLKGVVIPAGNVGDVVLVEPPEIHLKLIDVDQLQGDLPAVNSREVHTGRGQRDRGLQVGHDDGLLELLLQHEPAVLGGKPLA